MAVHPRSRPASSQAGPSHPIAAAATATGSTVPPASRCPATPASTASSVAATARASRCGARGGVGFDMWWSDGAEEHHGHQGAHRDVRDPLGEHRGGRRGRCGRRPNRARRRRLSARRGQRPRVPDEVAGQRHHQHGEQRRSGIGRHRRPVPGVCRAARRGVRGQSGAAHAQVHDRHRRRGDGEVHRGTPNGAGVPDRRGREPRGDHGEQDRPGRGRQQTAPRREHVGHADAHQRVRDSGRSVGRPGERPYQQHRSGDETGRGQEAAQGAGDAVTPARHVQ